MEACLLTKLLAFRRFALIGARGRDDAISLARRVARRGLLIGLAASLTGLSFAQGAYAAAWPDRPVTIIVPFPPGGNTDTMARLLAKKLSEKFNQSFIVDNRAGASGAIGTTAVARATPDGYTLLFAAVQQISVIPYTEHVNYDPKRDLAPISIFGEGPFILAVNGQSPAKSMADLIANAKAEPGKLIYASGGVGSLTHLVAALFAEKAGIKLIHVPYRGGGPAVADFIAAHAQVYFGNASELIPFVGDDRVRIIGVSTEKRMAQLPDVPAVSEVFKGFKMTSWNGLLGPSKMPKDILDKLATATIEAAHEPDVVKILTSLGIAPAGTTPQEFADTITSTTPLLNEAIKAADLAAP
jgi:tripartite-type tricarboxylate transporter receptor subunit TctC